MLNILSAGETEPANSLYELAAHAISLLRKDEPLAPNDLFTSLFRLLNALGPLDRWGTSSLEEIAIDHWSYAAASQRFAFTNPSTHCELIKKECENQTLHGYAKVASILQLAAAALRIRLSEGAENMLSTIKSHGRLVVPT